MDGEWNGPTPAQSFADAVCAAGPDELSSTEALMLLMYARAAKRGADAAWLTQRRIMQQCKIGSHGTVVRVRRSLVKKGWLAPIDVIVIRGGQLTVYRMAIPTPDPMSGSGNGLPDPMSEPGSAGSDPMSGSLRDEPDPTIGSLQQPDPMSVSGRRAPDPMSESSRDGSDPIIGSVGETKRSDQTFKAVRSSPRSDPIIGPGIPPQTAPPVGGEPSRVRAAADAHARAREAATPDGAAPRREKASKNGELSQAAKDAIASMRKIPGKPGEGSTDVNRPSRTER